MRKQHLYASVGALYVIAQFLTAIRFEAFPIFPEPYNLVPAGVIAYLSIFVVANVVNEKEGKRESDSLIVAGIFVNFLLLLNLFLESMLPEAKGIYPGYTSQTFQHLLHTEVRVVVGSVVAFALALLVNNLLYHRWRWNIYRKYTLVLIIAMALDTAIFHVIAYSGTLSAEQLVGSIATVTLFKIVLSIVSIPVFAFGLRGYAWFEPIEEKAKVAAGG